jgi:glucan phosphoethanolaminetransferase (alkaline phosphatase superfamily)
MRPSLRLLFGAPDSPIDRRTYLILGASLMAFKYIVDAAVIAIAAGVFWTPVDYLLPMITFNSAKVARFTPGLSIWLLLWTLPFIWIGVVLSVRRAIDARIFPGVVVAFFVPLLNYTILHAIHRRVLGHVKAEAERMP